MSSYLDNHNIQQTSWGYRTKLTNYNVKCKCGHVTHIRPKIDSVICSWCGQSVYTKRGDFKNKLKEKMRGERNV